MKDNRKQLPHIAVYVILFTIVAYFSNHALWVHDDLNQAFYGDRYPESITEIFKSQWNHYIGANGRFVAHWIVQFILVYVGKLGFSILNGCVYVIFVWLITKLTKQQNLLATIFVAAMSLIAFQTKFTPTCQVGYVWMFTLIMYAASYWDKAIKWSLLPIVAVIGFVAGWSQESLCIGLAPVLAVYGILHIKKLTKVQWALCVGFAIGCCFLIFSPANFNRAEANNVGLFDSLKNFMIYSKAFFLMIMLLIYEFFKSRKNFGSLLKANIHLLCSIVVLLLFNIGIGVFANRQLFGIELLSIFVVLSVFNMCDIKRNVKCVVSSAVICYALAICVYDYRYLENTNKVYSELMSQYKKSTDGNVFYDFSASDIIGDGNIPSEGFDEKVIESLNRKLKADGERKTMCVFPSFLREKLDAVLPTQAVRINDDSFLLIASKSDGEKEFGVNREINLRVISRPIGKYVVNSSDPLFGIDRPAYKAAVVYRGNQLLNMKGVDIN